MVLRIVSVKMPETYLILIDKLVSQGVCVSRSDCIRRALWEFINREMRVIQPVAESMVGTQKGKIVRDIKVID
jgi:hypothetical protein